MQGSLAAAAGVALRQPPWWLPIHLLFGPGLVLAARLPVAPGWFLGGFLLLVLVYWSSFRSQVPLYPSSRAVAAALLELMPPSPCRVLDLGSGTGGLLRALARARPDCRFAGIETAPLPWLIARLRSPLPPNLELTRGNLWKEPLANYQVVYAFLSPVPMAALWAKAVREMRTGSLLISNSFPVPGVVPGRVLELADRSRTRLYLYRL